MKYTVLFGSPHKRGATASLLAEYINEHDDIDSFEIIHAYDVTLKPCIGCGGCIKGKCVRDDSYVAEEIYKKISSADAFILASPVYFNSVPSPLKCIIDRMQPYYMKKYVLGDREELKKGGVLLLCGGEKEREGRKEMLKVQLKFAFDVFGYEISDYIYKTGLDVK